MAAIVTAGTISGGRSNTDSNASLGGAASYYPVGSGLFDDVSSDEAKDGRIEYRCMYLFNEDEEKTLENVKVFTTNKVDSDSSVEIGILDAAESQLITLFVVATGQFDGGSFDVTVTPTDGSGPVDVTVAFDSDPTTFAQNLETAINTVIDSVTVTLSHHNQTIEDGPYSIIFFFIEFIGNELNRPQNPLALGEGNITIVGGIPDFSYVLYTFKEMTKGSPLGAVSSSIDKETTPPTGIFFQSHTIADPLEIGSLLPLEGFPIWIKRTIPSGADQIDNDGVTLRMIGNEAE